MDILQKLHYDTIFHFVDVALRAVSILKKHLLYLSKEQHTFICLDLSIGSMLERLVLRTAVECTSQVSNGRLELEL